MVVGFVLRVWLVLLVACRYRTVSHLSLLVLLPLLQVVAQWILRLPWRYRVLGVDWIIVEIHRFLEPECLDSSSR